MSRAILAAVLLLLTACRDSSREHNAAERSKPLSVDQDVRRQSRDSTRRWFATRFDTAWTLGGDAADTLLGSPARMKSVGGLVVMTDPGYRRVLALHAIDGSVAWINTQLTEGLPDRSHLLALAPRGKHTIAVVDERNSRITELADDGSTQRVIAFRPQESVDAFCAVGSGLLVNSTDSLGPLYTMSPDDRTKTRVPFPFDDGRDLNAVALQARMVSNPANTRCVMSLVFGGGLALWDGARFVLTARYIEEMPLPIPKKHETTKTTYGDERRGEFTVIHSEQTRLPQDAIEGALDIAVTADRIRVLFLGRTALRGRIVDDYDAHTLAYLGSTVLPFFGQKLTAPSPDMIVILTERHTYPMLVALTPHVEVRK